MTDNIKQRIRLLERQKAIVAAREDLLAYSRLQMPDADDPDDATKSRFEITPQAKLLAQILQKAESGDKRYNRVAVSIGPQLGKSQIISRNFPAWATGRNPYRNIMLGTYNQTFAEEFGADVRTLIESNVHQAVFPAHNLTKGAVNLLITEQGGKTAFVGVGGSGTGKPADLFIVDDPIRSDDDAQSEIYRQRIWKWFNSVVTTRMHSKSALVVVHTRWHTDDLIGRLCDPEHPERNKEYKGVADRWLYINLPVVVSDPKMAKELGLTLEVSQDQDVREMFGDKPISSLWPERKGLEFLAEAKRMDPRTFSALYMGQPAAEDGEFFNTGMLLEYDRHNLPSNLRKYGASDHAVSTKSGRDYTVAGCVGVDDNDDIWILPDIDWRRMPTDQTVESLLSQFRRHKPDLWWMESELISKSFGPFLHKRMLDEKIYVTIDPVRPAKDKSTRAQSIRGRMSMGKVHFPRFAPWWQDARAQLLRFPFSANDDFVDWLSHIGMGLERMSGPARISAPANDDNQTGTLSWIMRSSLKRAALGNKTPFGGM